MTDLEHFEYNVQGYIFSCDYTDEQVLNLIKRMLKNRKTHLRLKNGWNDEWLLHKLWSRINYIL